MMLVPVAVSRRYGDGLVGVPVCTLGRGGGEVKRSRVRTSPFGQARQRHRALRGAGLDGGV